MRVVRNQETVFKLVIIVAGLIKRIKKSHFGACLPVNLKIKDFYSTSNLDLLMTICLFL